MRIWGWVWAVLLFGVSCSRQSSPPPICCSFPAVSIFLLAGVESRESITISQVGDYVSISRDGCSSQVANDRAYRALRATLFKSEKWRLEADEQFYQGPWMGKPRTILSLEHRENGLFLQGEEVPKEWIIAIQTYADRKLGK